MGQVLDIWIAAANGNIEVAKQAIADGADVNGGLEAGDLGGTPLHTAVDKGHKEIVELLIAEGADVNANKRSGKTPLDSAEDLEGWYTPGDKVALKEVADLLRKHGDKTGEELKAEGK